MPILYTLKELSALTGLPPRTIRYYTVAGLMPPPQTRGRYALYSEAHKNRLLLVIRLKEAFLPLDAIKTNLAKLDDQQVAALLGDEAETPAAEPEPVVATADAQTFILETLEGRRKAAEPSPALLRAAAEEVAGGATWIRIKLRPGVELHFQTPLKPKDRAYIDKLLNA